jgi:predicted RNA methylase
MRKLASDMVLRIVPNLDLHIESNRELKILSEGLSIKCNSHGLAVLDAFAQPTSLTGALKKLQSSIKGAQEWMELTNTITRLYEFGVLQGEADRKPTLRADPVGYDAAQIHVAMLNDRKRTDSYLKAISEVVRPGDVVVEIGTGTGVLAVGAARAGARKVYAIESSGIGEMAKAVFAANGLADRITLINGWSTQVDLPERADVLISEMIGDEPLGERVIEVTTDAVKRLLKPGARLIPNHLKVCGVPVTIPDEVIMKHSFTHKSVHEWQRSYGITFNPLAEIVRKEPYMFKIKAYKARDWKQLSGSVILTEIDFDTHKDLRVGSEQTVYGTASGELNGFVMFFELSLSPRIKLSTHPDSIEESNHWQTVAWILPEPHFLHEGDQVDIVYRHRKSGAKLECSFRQPK